jgi:hypothetical protein
MENSPENKIQEAETQEPSVLSELDPIRAKKRKNDWLIELFLFLILGILIGVAIKTEAIKRVTIGYDDYKMKIKNQDYNINKIREGLAVKQAQEEQQNNQGSPADQGNNNDQNNQPAQ